MIISYTIIKIINNISFEKGNLLITKKTIIKTLKYKFGKLKFRKKYFSLFKNNY